VKVDLDKSLEAWVQDRVARGDFETADQVVAEGLRLLIQRDALSKGELERWRGQIAEGLEQLDRGEYIEGEAFFDQLEAGKDPGGA